jgi:hypothetical protein
MQQNGDFFTRFLNSQSIKDVFRLKNIQINNGIFLELKQQLF